MRNLVKFCWLAGPCLIQAAPAASQHAIFTGRNVYSPALDYDDRTGTLKMWYGGWQSEADYPHDKIYYRQSKDGLRWSGPQVVLTPSQLPVAAVHVNDPAVVTGPNSTGKLQYTMFYTVCVQPCTTNADNQLWSSVSADGLHWQGHKPLIQSGGAAVPSAVALKKGQALWRIYYSNTSEANNSPTHVFMADVDGGRNLVSKDRVAYTFRGSGVIANPEVREVGGVWNLVFNVYHTLPGARRNTADIYFSQSSSPDRWQSGSERPLIVNDPNGDTCASVAPALIEAKGRLLLQFGQAHYRPSGVCDFSVFDSMQQLEFEATSLKAAGR